MLFTDYFAITASYKWSWGSENANGDATWWNELKNWIDTASSSELSACVGKTKGVTLSTAVSGTTTHLVRCIGANQDGNRTLTFQTANCLKELILFDVTNTGIATWSDSNVKPQCVKYYNAFPGKSSIKIVRKGTNTEYNTDSVVYTNETVWLPSIYEMGFTNSVYTPIGAEYTYGESNPYSYYTNNTRRTKKIGDSGSAAMYWTRSRSKANMYVMCTIETDGTVDGGISTNA